MGAQWKHAGRIENSSKRGALISKLVKEITVASKVGDSHSENNPRLRVAVEAARKASVSRGTIERAIKSGAGLLEQPVHYELITYEGFTPHQVPVIVECLTENKNRTAADIRVLFRKGQLGSPGSVSWMFDRVGIVEATHAMIQDIEGVAIEAGAQNVEVLNAGSLKEVFIEQKSSARFFCNPEDLDSVSKYLIKSDWSLSVSEISYLAKTAISVSLDAQKEVVDFLTNIDDHEDVHRIYAALKTDS